MKKFAILFLFVLAGCVCSSCAWLDQKVSPENQCRVIRVSAKLAFSFGIKKIKDQDRTKLAKISVLIKKEILPKLEGKDGKELTKKEWDDILGLLDKKVPDKYKPAIQAALVYLVAYTPKVKAPFSSLGQRFLYYAKCLFFGILDGVSSMKIRKAPKSIKGAFEEQCKDCK